jgi:hypothetical protein
MLTACLVLEHLFVAVREKPASFAMVHARVGWRFGDRFSKVDGCDLTLTRTCRDSKESAGELKLQVIAKDEVGAGCRVNTRPKAEALDDDLRLRTVQGRSFIYKPEVQSQVKRVPHSARLPAILRPGRHGAELAILLNHRIARLGNLKTDAEGFPMEHRNRSLGESFG